MRTKICPKCKVEKPLVEIIPKEGELIGFTKYEFNKKGGWCRNCIKNYRQDPKVKFKRKEVDKKFKQKYDMSYNQYYGKKRMENDPVKYLKTRTSNLIRSVFKNKKFSKSSRTAKILCCSYEEFYHHLTNNCEITYDPKQHHIDHIIPVSLARTEEECIALNHYKNFRLLPASENISKGNKLPSIFELNPGIPDLAFQVYMRNV